MAKKREVKESFGQRIRSVRKEKGLSLEDLSLEIGYPLDILEKVEKDEIVPPVSLVLQIGRTLKVDMEQLEVEEEKDAAKRRVKSHKKRVESYAYTSLTKPGLDRHLRAYLVTIDPLTEHKGVEYHHEGEEFIYVLKGGVIVQVGQNITTLDKEGNLHFNSALRHKLSNPTKETTELLVVIYVP